MIARTSESQPTVHIVIVNWNAGQLLTDCICSLASVNGTATAVSRITVVDNGSRDGSLERLPETSFPLTIVRNAANIGFGAACNQAALNSDADFLLFLNPDTRLSADSLDGPARAFADPSNSAVGIIGIRLIDRESRTSRHCARRPTLASICAQTVGLDRLGLRIFPPHFLTEWDHEQTRPVDQVMGAFFFVRASVFRELGGFDERFFVYYEDLDFAIRARDTGWSSLYLATSSAVHQGAGTTEQVKDVRLFYYWRSRIIYARKHFGLLGGVAITLLTLTLDPLARIVFLLSQRRSEVSAVWRALRFLLADIPRWIRGDTRSSIPPAQ